jgi:copper(I)-binding protein
VIRIMRRLGGRRLLVLVVAALIPALAGCETGTNAPTQQWHQPTDGSDAVHGKIAVRDAFVLGAPLGQKLAAGHAAGLFLALTNSGPKDELVGVSAPGTAKSVTLPSGGVSLATQGVVLLTGPAPKLILNDLSRPLYGGSTVRLVLKFQNAANATITAPVMPRAQYYSTFSPAPSASPTTAKSKHKVPVTGKPRPSPSSAP